MDIFLNSVLKYIEKGDLLLGIWWTIVKREEGVPEGINRQNYFFTEKNIIIIIIIIIILIIIIIIIIKIIIKQIIMI